MEIWDSALTSKYYLGEGATSRDEAYTLCLQKCARLVDVNSAEEHQVLIAKLTEKGEIMIYVVGYSSNTTNSTFNYIIDEL